MTDLTGKKIAIIATDHFEEAELVTPRDELTKAGAEVKVYSAERRPDPGRRGRHRADAEDRRGRHLRRPRRLDASTPWWCPAARSTPTTIRTDEDAQEHRAGGLRRRQGARGHLPRPVAAGQRRAGRGPHG